MGRKVTGEKKPQTKSSNIYVIAGERIKYIRSNKLYTQEQLADYVGRIRNEINMYENGKRIFDFQTLVNIADALDVSTDYLLGRTELESFDENIKITHQTTGLSDFAITNLIQLKDDGNGVLLDTINFLLEQENYPYEAEKLKAYNTNNDKDIEKHSNKQIKKYEKEDHQNVLMAIDNYFHVSIDKKHKLYLTNKGVKLKEEFSNDKQLEILTQKAVNTKEIIDKVFLDEINNKIAMARDKFQQGDDT